MSQNKDIKGVEQVIDLQKEELIHVIDGKKREEEFKTVQEPDNLLTRFVKGLHNAMFNSIEEKNKPTDEERNMIALNDKIQIEIEEPLKMIFEAILHLVNYEEKKVFSDSNYSPIYNKTETIIDFLIQELQSSQKELYDPNNKEKMFYHEKLIQMNLFLIYIIIKNYPFFINKRDTLEKYFRQLMCYKK